MELKVTKTKTEEVMVQIELPYYSKTYAHYYKVVSEKEILKLYNGIGSFGIEYIDFTVSNAFGDDAVQVTEDEFNAAYFNIQSKLNQQL